MTIQDPTYGVFEQVVQMRERGQVTIPADLRRELGLKDGDVFSIIKMGDTLVWVRKKLVAIELADRIAQIAKESGVTLDDLLAQLDIEREQYYKEKYGSKDQGVS